MIKSDSSDPNVSKDFYFLQKYSAAFVQQIFMHPCPCTKQSSKAKAKGQSKNDTKAKQSWSWPCIYFSFVFNLLSVCKCFLKAFSVHL